MENGIVHDNNILVITLFQCEKNKSSRVFHEGFKYF